VLPVPRLEPEVPSGGFFPGLRLEPEVPSGGFLRVEYDHAREASVGLIPPGDVPGDKIEQWKLGVFPGDATDLCSSPRAFRARFVSLKFVVIGAGFDENLDLLSVGCTEASAQGAFFG
jgi:hypothetical protein